jgi:hypothetical protein
MINIKLPFRRQPISINFGRSSIELSWGDIFALLLSQTRLFVVVLKLFTAQEKHKNLIIIWNLALLCCSAAVCALADLLVQGAKNGDAFGSSAVHISVWCICAFLAYFAAARIFEILYAFYKDAMDKVESKPKRSGLTKKNRLQLLFLSYIELVLKISRMQSISAASRLQQLATATNFQLQHWVVISSLVKCFLGLSFLSSRLQSILVETIEPLLKPRSIRSLQLCSKHTAELPAPY